MKHTIQDLNGNILVLSDEEIKVEDEIYVEGHETTQTVKETTENDYECYNGLPYIKEKCKKIISSSQPLEGVKPLLNSRIELLQMIKEKEIERLARNHADSEMSAWVGISDEDTPANIIQEWNGFYFGFIAGAKLSSFTEEQMRKGMEDAVVYFTIHEQYEGGVRKWISDYLSSQPIPTIEVTIQEVDGGVKVKSITN